MTHISTINEVLDVYNSYASIVTFDSYHCSPREQAFNYTLIQIIYSLYTSIGFDVY